MRSPILLLLVLLAALLPGASGGADRSTLSGIWILDQEQSESLRQKMRDGAAGGSRADLRRERVAARERAMLARAPFAEIDVVAGDELVEIGYRDGSKREIHTDGRDLGPDPANGVLAARARWQDSALIIENDTQRGQRIERWQLSEDGSRLFVTIEIDASETLGRIDFTRIYDRRPPEAAPGAADGDN